MKKVNCSTIFMLVLVVFAGVLSFVSCNLSYSKKNESEEIKEIVSEPIVEENNDEEVFAALEGLMDPRLEKLAAMIELPKVVIADKDDKEDPNIEIKKNEANKGVAKETTVKEAKKTYETNETSFGIDVSTWQGDINWKKVKQSGVSFAMIRVGFRKMDSGTIVMDNQFLDNIKGAKANNINVGIYFFSMAKNETEALEEAKWVYNVIKDYDITYPVAIDTEIFNKHRLKGVSYSTLTNNAITFCKYIKGKGYTPMIYSYANAFTKYFDTAKFANYRIWLAQFNDKVTYKGKYHMWQYTSSGSVPGIKGRVDMNVAYFSVTNDATKASTVNGITNTGNLDPVDFIDMNMNTILTKKVNVRTSPYENLPNKAGSLDMGTNVVITGMGKQYVRLTYNDDTFYVKDTDCFEMRLNEVLFDKVDLTVKVNKEVKLLKKPYLFLKNNEDRSLTLDEEINIIGINVDFVEVKINEEIYYVNDVDFYEILNDNMYNKSGSNGGSANGS